MRVGVAARVMGIALLLGCATTPYLDQNRWGAVDGRSFDGPPFLVGDTQPVILDELDERLGIVTWPELAAVPCVVSVEDRDRLGPVVWLTPEGPLGDRWYAIRWTGERNPGTSLDGAIPLTDGSWVWRFHGRYVPEFGTLEYSGGVVTFGAFDLDRRIGVVVRSCGAPVRAVIIEQGDQTWDASCGPSDVPFELPVPGFDPGSPFRVQVLPNALFTDDGLAFQAIDLVLESALSSTVPLPPARMPPPVPAALCAGLACE